MLGPVAGVTEVTVGAVTAIDWVVVATELDVKCMDVNAVSALVPVRFLAAFTLLHEMLATMLHESKDVGRGATPMFKALVPSPIDPLND